jgi:hypothetical protein
VTITLERDDIEALSEGAIPAWSREACNVRLDAIDTVGPTSVQDGGTRDDDDDDDEQYRQMARALHGRDGEIEIDDNADVSRGNDPGAYVQAWVWVSTRLVQATV